MPNFKSIVYSVLAGLSVITLGLWALQSDCTEPRRMRAIPEDSLPSLPASPTLRTYSHASLPTLTPRVGHAAVNMDERIAQAKARGEAMRKLIRTNPEQAIQESLSISEWSELAPEIQKYVEQPFSALANVDVMIACGDEGSRSSVVTTFSDIGTMETFVYGRRCNMGSKIGIPVQGIRIGDVGALHEDIFQPLATSDEAAALKRFPVAVADPGGESVAALAGGRLFYFRSRMELDEANHRLAALEALPGVNAGAQSLFESLEAISASEGGIDFETLEAMAYAASTAWTGTPRDMYVILVDFSDLQGQPTDPVALSNSINTIVSQQIWDMSYKKTHIVCTVDPATYRMDDISTSYVDTLSTYPNANRLYANATSRVEAAGIDLAPYETICVLFADIAGVSYSGLATVGGRRLWMNGSISTKSFTHELGHNYGARHANSWEVSGSDPVAPAGAAIEYGDFTDIMGSGPMPAGHFNALHKKRLNWFDADNWQSISNSGTYRIYRSDHRETLGLLRGVEIYKAAGEEYWVGLRQEMTAYDTFSRGAYVLWKQSIDNRSNLLDMTPSSADGKYDGGLALGQTYSDPVADIHITPIARGGQTPNEWMDVTINLGPFPGNTAPTATLSGASNASVRTSMLFSVAASDPDGDTLAYHWDTGDGLVKPNSETLVAAWIAGGTATVSCTVSDMKGGTNHTSQSVVISDPLDNWTPRTSGTTLKLMDVASGGGRLVVVTGEETTLYSDDGTNWTAHTSFDVSPNNIYLQAVTYDGSQFIAVGMDYDLSPGHEGWEQVAYTSSNGTSWTERYDSDSESGSYIRLRDVAFGGGNYVAVGDEGTIVRSSNGTNWSSAVSGTATDLKGVSYGDGVFVVVGDEGGYTPHVVLTSADGLTWTDYSAGALITEGNQMVAVEYCFDRFVAGGWNSETLFSTNQGMAFTSTSSGSLDLTAFTHGDGLYFAAGLDIANADADINLVSLDGVNWTELTTTSQDNRNAAVFYDGTFVTVGDNGSIWQSDAVGSLVPGFAVWQLEHGDALGLDRDPFEDADHDGSVNLIEYAMGTLATDAGSLPTDGLTLASGSYFQLSYERDGIKGDIDYTVERTTNLLSNDWSSASTVIMTNNATTLTVRSAIPMASQTNEFFRLTLELK